jgi:enoyl-CoA hydratase
MDRPMIVTEQRGAITLVTIDRPERRNALDHDALDGLLAALDGAVAANSRVLVLTGSTGHFCAGADLTTVEDDRFIEALHRLLDGLRTAPFPSIAAIDGAALGAGTQLAVACDLRMATPTATFGIPAAKLGLMTDQWTIKRLVGFVGQGPARAMCLAAETYSGEQAERLGLVQRIAEPDGLVDDALAWAEVIAAFAPLTIAGFKVGLNEAEAVVDWTPAYRAAFEAAWASADLQEGLAAFAERRPPQFGGT